MAISMAAKNTKSYIHVAIMLALMLGIGYLPPFAQVTPLGMKVLGVFLGLVYGWCFIDLLWTSVLGFFALGLTGCIDTTSAVAAAFGNQSVIIILVCFAFADCVNRIGVTTAISYWALGRKIFVGRPWVFIIGVIVVSMILSVFGAYYAAMFLMWAVVDKVAEINNIPKGSLLTSMLGAMIVYACFTGCRGSALQCGCDLIRRLFYQCDRDRYPGNADDHLWFILWSAVFCDHVRDQQSILQGQGQSIRVHRGTARRIRR